MNTKGVEGTRLKQIPTHSLYLSNLSSYGKLHALTAHVKPKHAYIISMQKMLWLST